MAVWKVTGLLAEERRWPRSAGFRSTGKSCCGSIVSTDGTRRSRGPVLPELWVCFDEIEARDSSLFNPRASSLSIQQLECANVSLRWVDWRRNRSEQCGGTGCTGPDK